MINQISPLCYYLLVLVVLYLLLIVYVSCSRVSLGKEMKDLNEKAVITYKTYLT